MTRRTEQVVAISEQGTSENSLVVAVIDSVEEDGSAFVFLPGFESRIKARTAVQLSQYRDDPDQLIGRVVLVSVVDYTLEDVIIVGLISDTLWPTNRLETSFETVQDSSIDVKADGRSVIINAEKEIVLRCGRSSIELRSDGKVVVKGMRVTTRAAKTNKIKGASVNIN